jgi:hypothetical protein
VVAEDVAEQVQFLTSRRFLFLRLSDNHSRESIRNPVPRVFVQIRHHHIEQKRSGENFSPRIKFSFFFAQFALGFSGALTLTLDALLGSFKSLFRIRHRECIWQRDDDIATSFPAEPSRESGEGRA